MDDRGLAAPRPFLSRPRLVEVLGNQINGRVPRPFRVFRSAAKSICDWLHRRQPPRACNVIGHSTGALMGAYAAGRGVGVNFLMTMAPAPVWPNTVDRVYTGNWFGLAGPVSPRPWFWINLKARYEWWSYSRLANWNIQTAIDHKAFWGSWTAAHYAEKGICIVRHRLRHWGPWDNDCHRG